MKKIFFATLMMLAIAITSFAGNSTGVDTRTITAFEKDYPAARNSSWEKGNNFSKVSFELNGNRLTAYYSPVGALIATSRNLSTTELPLRLFIDLKKDYSNYWVTDLFEMSTEQSNEYYLTIENSDKIIILRSYGNEWESYEEKTKN